MPPSFVLRRCAADSVGTLLLLAGGGARQRGIVAVVIAAAWDGCCCRLATGRDSVGTLLLSALKINSQAEWH